MKSDLYTIITPPGAFTGKQTQSLLPQIEFPSTPAVGVAIWSIVFP